MKITKRDISFRSFSLSAIVDWVNQETDNCPDSIESLTIVRKQYNPNAHDAYNTHEVVLEVNEN